MERKELVIPTRIRHFLPDSDIPDLLTDIIIEFPMTMLPDWAFQFEKCDVEIRIRKREER